MTMSNFATPRPAGAGESRQPLASLRDMEVRHIAHVLDHVGWSRARASRILGITRWSLARRLRKYGLQPPADVPPPVAASAGAEVDWRCKG